jgi:methylphosphotriester-DNA--protein-cysteine methyltransferase
MQTLRKFTLVALLAASGLMGCTEKATEQAATQCPQNAVAYVASVHRAPFHRPDCRSAQRISPSNLQTFSTRDEAIQAGHRPCKVCSP